MNNPLMQMFLPDAQTLRTAMKGFGTDEKSIIRVVSGHNFLEREHIAEVFAATYGMDLCQELEKELSFNLKKTIVSCFRPRFQFWAQAVHNGLQDIGLRPHRLFNLILTMSDYDISAVSKMYQHMYGVNMADTIISTIPNKDWSLLVRGWLKGNNTTNYNPQQGAQMLYNAAKGAGTDEEIFVQVMCTATPESYRQINAAYPQLYGKTLEDTIIKEFSGASEKAFLLTHYYLLNPVIAVANVLMRAMKGMGTDDDSLIYATVVFCDYFKGGMIAAGFQQWGDLAKAIKSDLGGKYETAILALWGLQ